MKVIGEVTIFKNEQGNYSTSISNKKEDGTYENMYISVQFKKGVVIPNKTKIDVDNGFLSFFKTKEGMPKVKLVITEFTSELETQDTAEFITIDSTENLPF